MDCPVCGSFGSSILMAYQRGEPCPICGVTGETMFEIIRIRESHANKALKDKIEVYIKECDRLQRKLSMYERFAVQIADAVETLDVQGNL